MLRMDRALLGNDIPAAVAALLRVDDAALLDDFRTLAARCLGVSMRGAGRVEMSLERVPHGADELLLVQQGKTILGLLHRNEFRGDAKIPIARMRHFQPVETLPRGDQHDAARKMHTCRLARDGLDLTVEIDRILLQLRHIRIAVERVETPSRMPGRARRQHVAVEKDGVSQTAFRQMIKNGTSDDAAADDNDLRMRTHVWLSPA